MTQAQDSFPIVFKGVGVLEVESSVCLFNGSRAAAFGPELVFFVAEPKAAVPLKSIRAIS